MADQMTFKRYEVKYLIAKNKLDDLMSVLDKHMIPDEHGLSTIQSLYYDTTDFRIIRKSLEKPVYKEKLRLRSYGLAKDDTIVFAELKKKYESVVYKRRIALPLKGARGYMPETDGADVECTKRCLEKLADNYYDNQVRKEIDNFVDLYKGIRPSMLLIYDRRAYYGANDHEFRITIDDNVRYRRVRLGLDYDLDGKQILPAGYVLMEVKAGGAMPGWLASYFSENKIYPTSFSKYGTAYIKEFFENKENI